MKSEDERKWFDFHGIQPELAELYRYFDRTVLCYRIIIATMYKEAVQNAVKDALKGKPPKAGNGGDKPSMTKEQILAVKNPSERQKLIAENITLFQ